MAQNQCAVCKTEFTPIDEVIPCPSCGVTHHVRCWGQNNGCATYGCLQTADDAQPRNLVPCPRCQKLMREGLAFCPNCGAKQERPAAKLCVRCSIPLERDMQYCPTCGQKVELPVDPAIARAIASYNEGLNRRKPQSKAKPFVIAIIVILALAACTVTFFGIKANLEETQRTMYLNSVAKFSDKVYDSSDNLAAISDAVVQYWYDSIYYSKYENDINVAIETALSDYSDEIQQAEADRQEIGDLYLSLRRLKVGDLWQIDAAMNVLYTTYTVYYNMAINPSGNYNTYSKSNKDMKAEFTAKYEALVDLLEKAGGK